MDNILVKTDSYEVSYRIMSIIINIIIVNCSKESTWFSLLVNGYHILNEQYFLML